MSATVDNTPIYRPVPDLEDDKIDLGDLIATILQAKWLVLSISLIVFLGGLSYALLATPIYEADVLIQVEEKSSSLGDFDITELFEGDTSVNAEIEILRSRLILGDVVDDLKLEIISGPDYIPVIGPAIARRTEPTERNSIQVDTLNLPSELIGKELTLVAGEQAKFALIDPEGKLIVNGEVGSIASTQSSDPDPVTIFVSKLVAEPGDKFIVYRQSRLNAIRKLQSTIRLLEKGKNSGMIAISLEGNDPVNVSEQLNAIADIYVRQNVERKSAEAEKTLLFLDEQLPIVKQEMEAAEVALNTFRLEKGSIDLPLETQAILESVVEVEGQLNRLKQERDKVTQAFTAAHPVVIALDRQIERLISELNALNERVKELPITQQEVLRLFRDAEVNTALYTSLLNTAQELRVVKAGTVGNVRIVDYAVPRLNPIKPRQSRVLAVSLVFGIFFGLVGAFVRKALKDGVDDPDLIERQTGIPVYAVVAHSGQQETLFKKMKSGKDASCVLAVDNPEDPSIESLRNLRTTLHFGMMDAKNNIILICGPAPSVGKSFVSVNLAAVLACTNKKVLLIDGDMRKGHLNQYLGLERQNGLSDFISGRIKIGDAIHKTPIRDLDFIPTGSLPPNPAELLLNKRLSNCLNVLAPRYHHVIIDSPPILAVTDATIIGQHAGTTLMVARAGEHPMREIEQSVKRLRQSGANLRGVLFNDLEMSSRRYGYGKYNYYQYTYK